MSPDELTVVVAKLRPGDDKCQLNSVRAGASRCWPVLASAPGGCLRKGGG
jgi:hypothetical protein